MVSKNNPLRDGRHLNRYCPYVEFFKRPSSEDIRHPKTGQIYSQPYYWRVSLKPNGLPPVTGVAGELWYLQDITANVANWKQLVFTGGGSPIITITGDAGGGVSADAFENMNLNGLVVANQTRAKPVFFTGTPGAFTQDLEVQVAAAITGAPGDKLDAGICSFDDTAFSVDIDGNVTLVGGAGPTVDTFTTDVGGPVVPTGAGVIDTTGTTVFTDGTVANTLTLNVQSAAETFLLGAGAGASATELGPLTDGQLIIGSTGVSPALGPLIAGNAMTVTPGPGSITLHADVAGPVSSADEAIARWDGTGGDTIQTSSVFITNGGDCTGMTRLDVDNLRMDGNKISTTNSNRDINLQADGSGKVQVDNAELRIQLSNSGSNNVCAVRNTSATANSGAQIKAGVTNSAGGDAFLNVEIEGTRSYCWGIDNTDDDILKMNALNGGNVNPSGGTNLWAMTGDGECTMPKQPAFNAFLNSTANNVTGDGTVFTIGDTDTGTGLTERFNQGGHFTRQGSGGAFLTAPVTGKYQLQFFTLFQDLDGATHVPALQMTTSNEVYFYGSYASPPAGDFAAGFSVLADMDTADTANFQCVASGGAKTVDIYGESASPTTVVSGFLAC